MEKNYASQIIGTVAILLAGIISGCSPQPETLGDVGIYSVPSVETFSFKEQTNTYPGVGFNYDPVKYTNSSGLFNISPSNGVGSFTFSDISGIADQSIAIGFDNNTDKTYGTNTLTNTVTFPVVASHTYKLTVFVKTMLPPTNGQPVLLQLLQNP